MYDMSRIRRSNPGLSEVTLRAIEEQINTRTLKDADGNLLCRHCSKVIPEDMFKVLKDPEREDRVWGPCCSDECICYLKICHGCYKDFIVNKPDQIKFINNEKWLCTECQGNLDICGCCGSSAPIRVTPLGKLCDTCYKTQFFTCSHCNTEQANTQQASSVELAKFSHILGTQKNICTDCFTIKTRGKDPLRVKACECCGETYGYKKVLNHSYCPTCIKTKKVKRCYHCNKFKHWYSAHQTIFGLKIICNNCATQYQKCEVCSCFDLKKNCSITKSSLHKKVSCSQCSKGFVECPKCLTIISKAQLINGGCIQCSGNICTRCGKNHLGERYCRKIMFDNMDYGYKPTPIFHFKGNNKKVFFGFENEINYPSKDDSLFAKRTIYEAYNPEEIYIKSDSTINGYGFEVVSHPMTLEFFKDFDLTSLFSINPIINDTSCGLHIHISKQSFQGDYHLYKFISFINNRSNKEFIESISGRSLNNSYGHLYSKKVSNVVKDKTSNERMVCVNLTNSSTYEVRIFRGAKTEEQLRYRVEFTLALVEFTRNTTNKDCTQEKFLKFLKNNYKEYKNLNEFLK